MWNKIKNAAKNALKDNCTSLKNAFRNVIIDALVLGAVRLVQRKVWEPAMRKINKLNEELGEEKRTEYGFGAFSSIIDF